MSASKYLLFILFLCPLILRAQLKATEKEALITFRLYHPETDEGWAKTMLKITSAANPAGISLFTDSKGELSVLLPVNTVYSLHLKDLPKFGNIEIGPAAFQQHVIPIPYDGKKVNGNNKNSISFQLQLVDKKGNALKNSEQVSIKDAAGKSYRLQSDSRGRATVNLDRKGPFMLSFTDAPDYYRFSVPDKNNSWEERVIFERKKGYHLYPNVSEGLLNFIYVDLNNKALPNEKFEIRDKKSGKTFNCTTNQYGVGQILVPLNSSYSFSTEFNPNFDEIEVKLREGYHIFEFDVLYQSPSSADWKKRMDLLDAVSSLKDSIIALNLKNESGNKGLENHIPLKNRKTFIIRKEVEEKAAVYRDSLKNNFKIFEKYKDPVLASLKRMNRDLSEAVIVTDVTHSMEPYMEEVLVWHALNLGQGHHNRFVFFNDGDEKLSREKEIGKTGGLYFTEGNIDRLDSIIMKMQEASAVRMGGGEPAENDLEAALSATKFKNVKEIILIADAHSPVRDMALLQKISIPVRIILCGAEELNSFYFTRKEINEQYLTIAHRSGGSVHTLSSDILDLAQRKEGDVVELQGIRYLLKNRQFVRIGGN